MIGLYCLVINISWSGLNKLYLFLLNATKDNKLCYTVSFL